MEEARLAASPEALRVACEALVKQIGASSALGQRLQAARSIGAIAVNHQCDPTWVNIVVDSIADLLRHWNSTVRAARERRRLADGPALTRRLCRPGRR